MSVTRFAERVLCGDRLEDKLSPIESWEDPAASPPSLPPRPSRPPELAFDDPRPHPPSPRRADLDRPEGRGAVLHRFLNHELLALELMALALLRFPEAPASWRRGLVVIMHDEQRHAQSYLSRMLACGVNLGACPASRFFWDALHGAPTPAAFVAGMGLGLEQANLDFARQWSQWFRDAGDEPTAHLLDEVHADEVRHVRHAVRSWPRLTGTPLTYESWSTHLIFPMTPARARGPIWDADGRRRAGLTDRFVRHLAVAGHGRGRTPTVFRFRAALEDDLGGRPMSAAARLIQDDLAHLPMFAAGPEDVVIAPDPPLELRSALAAAGLPICRFAPSPEAVSDPIVGRLEPWGWSAEAERALAGLVGRVSRGPTRGPAGSLPLHGKDHAVPWQDGPLDSRIYRALDEVQVPDGPWVIKAARSASGTRRVRGEGPSWPRGPVARWLQEDGAVVVQRWLPRVVDVSAHGDVTDDGPVFRGLVRFETGRGGAFRGARVGPPWLGLDARLRRFVHSPPDGVNRALTRAWTEVALDAAARGHRGPVGVDAMIVDLPEGLRLVPVVEVNPRWTMGRLALALTDRLAPGAVGWWRFVPVAALRGEPGGVAGWAARAAERAPPRLEGGRLRSGFLLTSPTTATSVVTALDLERPG